MDLPARRKQQAFEQERLRALREHLAEVCPGSSISYEIDRQSFEGDAAAIENLWLVVEQPSYVLEQICCDELGRTAVAGHLRRVVIANLASAGEASTSFDDGTLREALPCADGAAGTPGASIAPSAGRGRPARDRRPDRSPLRRRGCDHPAAQQRSSAP